MMEAQVRDMVEAWLVDMVEAWLVGGDIFRGMDQT